MSNVTSKPATTTYETQIIDSDRLADMAIILAWLFGVILPLIISTLGNYVAFGYNGDWSKVSWEIKTNALVYAILWQVCCSCAQFAFKAIALRSGGAGWWIAYIVSLIVSVVPSVIGYYGLVSVKIVAILGKRFAIEVAQAVAGLVITVVCTLFDMLPEWVSVKG